MKNRFIAISIILAAAGSLPGCGTASDTGETPVEPAPGDSAQIARLRAERAEQERLAEEAGRTYTINVEEHHIVRFILSEDGASLMIGERRLKDQKAVLDDLQASTVEDILAKLQPGTAVPDRLEPFRNLRPLQAESAGAEGEPNPAADVSEPDLVEKHITSSGSHYRDTHKLCPTRMNYGGLAINGNTTACELNMVRVTRNVNATHSGVMIGTYRASTVVSLSIAGSFLGSFSVLQGEALSSAGMSGTFRNCTFWSCGEWQVRTSGHQWGTDSSGESGAHHYGAVWVNRPSATRGMMTVITG